jgi:hypothetical protein
VKLRGFVFRTETRELRRSAPQSGANIVIAFARVPQNPLYKTDTSREVASSILRLASNQRDADAVKVTSTCHPRNDNRQGRARRKCASIISLRRPCCYGAEQFYGG